MFLPGIATYECVLTLWLCRLLIMNFWATTAEKPHVAAYNIYESCLRGAYTSLNYRMNHGELEQCYQSVLMIINKDVFFRHDHSCSTEKLGDNDVFVVLDLKFVIYTCFGQIYSMTWSYNSWLANFAFINLSMNGNNVAI